MIELLSRPIGELILIVITISLCVGGLILLFMRLFKPKHIKIGETDISSVDENINTNMGLRDLRLVIGKSVETGFEICKMKLVDVIQVQDQYADEKFEGWNLFVKEQFLLILGSKEEYKYNNNLSTLDESRLFFNVLRGFTEKCKSTLHLSFTANNFKYMTENEFQEMTRRKALMLESFFEKYFTDNYFEEICTLSVVEITKELKDIIKDDFNKLINNIFEFARIKKKETEAAVEQKKIDLETYIREYINKDFKIEI